MKHNISEKYCILWTAWAEVGEWITGEKKKKNTDGNLNIQMEQIVFMLQKSEKI